MSVIEANSSNYVTEGILSQYNEEGVLYPIAYFLKQLSPAKYNYRSMIRNYWPLLNALSNGNLN